MIDPKRVEEAVLEFMKNPTWKEIFTNAPSGAMERLAISFYFSKFHDQFKAEDFQEYRDLREEYEKSLNEEDLNYLIGTSDKEDAIQHYQELLNNLQQSGGQPQGNLRFENGEEGQEEQAGQRSGEEEEPPQEETPAEEEQPQPQQESVEEEAETAETESPDGEETEETEAAETIVEPSEEAPEGEENQDEGAEMPEETVETAEEVEESGEEAPEEESPGKKKEIEDGEEGKELDPKYETALSVALEYLQNEEKTLKDEG